MQEYYKSLVNENLRNSKLLALTKDELFTPREFEKYGLNKLPKDWFVKTTVGETYWFFGARFAVEG